MEEYLKFKQLLEYFVAHLEYCNDNNENSIGYIKYIKPIIESDTLDFKKAGKQNENIQKQIQDWADYKNGKIIIYIDPRTKYKSKNCHLYWEATDVIIKANWQDNNIFELVQEQYIKDSNNVELYGPISLDELGLFKDNITEELKKFYNNFNAELKKYKPNYNKETMPHLKPYIKLLKTNKNLILTGAPGTGKTFLAKEIAKQMILTENEDVKESEQIEFVQFHPSFDYTDFVEGLRPIKKDSEELAFELKDGIFKKFCKKALKNLIDSNKSTEELNKEEIINKSIYDFLDTCIENSNELKTSTGNKFTISEYTESRIKVDIPNNNIKKDLTIPLNELSKLLLKKDTLNKVKDIKMFFNRIYGRHEDSYIFTLYNEIKEKMNTKINLDIKKIERKNYIFIIDEINRAEISKVFGELFFSIDPGYRGEKGKVKTQYSNLLDESDMFYDGFYIPDNVYIIGTMNDIDRSVESMDFAMRRRFTWKEITSLERISMWNGKIDNFKNDAKTRMETLNKEIENIQGLSSAYHIGPAYFLKLEEYKETENPFEQLWENNLKGLIFEYLRGLPNSVENLKSLKNAYDLKNNVDND